MASSMPPGAHVQYIRVCQNPALSYLSPSPFLHPHSFHPAQSLHSLSVCLLLLCRYIYPQVLAVEASLAACSAATSGQRSLLLIPTASGQFSLPTAFCFANTELTGVGPSGSRDPSRSSLSVSLFLFSSPFSMLCILVWTAPAGVYISRYSSRRQAPRLRTLPLLFLQFKPNVATYSQAIPRLH
jgi:hypothetical protein